MKRLLLAGLAGATTLATVTPAQAHPNWHYDGACALTAVSDGTDSPQTHWDGEIDLWAVATDSSRTLPAPTASISAECELRINGASPGTVVASCATPGTGSVACVSQVSFTADPDDVVTLCELVTVNGDFHKECSEAGGPPIIPHPIAELVEEEVLPRLDAVTDITDDVVCPVTRRLDGTPLDNPPGFDVRRDGDTYVYADGSGTRVLDCDAGARDVDLSTVTGNISGRITIVDDGAGPVWSVSGELADPTHWNCAQTTHPGFETVVCDWLGGPGFPPFCSEASALAVSLPETTSPPVWGSANTMAICEGNLAAEQVSSGLATQADPLRYAARAMTPQYVTRVYCNVYGGGSGPQPRYLAECGFRF